MQITSPPPEDWLKITPAGLYCSAGDFMIDPIQPATRALITHGHADHARPGNQSVLATSGTLAIMQSRFGENAGKGQAVGYGETTDINGVSVTFLPAGHVLGSARSCSNMAAVAWLSRATTSEGATRPAKNSHRAPATCSSPKRPSGCRYSIIRLTRRRLPGFWRHSSASRSAAC